MTFDQQAVTDILRRRARGEPMTTIAVSHGITRERVRHIVERHRRAAVIGQPLRAERVVADASPPRRPDVSGDRGHGDMLDSMSMDTGHTVQASPVERPHWMLISNHQFVLFCIAQEPTIRMRDIAATVGITERAATRIVGDLIGGGYISRRRDGRRNVYEVNEQAPVRHPAWGEWRVRDLLPLARAPSPATVVSA